MGWGGSGRKSEGIREWRALSVPEPMPCGWCWWWWCCCCCMALAAILWGGGGSPIKPGGSGRKAEGMRECPGCGLSNPTSSSSRFEPVCPVGVNNRRGGKKYVRQGLVRHAGPAWGGGCCSGRWWEKQAACIEGRSRQQSAKELQVDKVRVCTHA
eukprot:1159840-Pelagomonas_calceolata.AAC.4